MTNERKLTGEDQEQIERLYNQNLPVARIASEFRVSIETVEYIIDRAWLAWGAAYGYDN